MTGRIAPALPRLDPDRERAKVALDVLSDLPGLLQRTRRRAGLSQREAAEQIGISPVSHVAYETERRQPKPDALVLILRWISDLPDAPPLLVTDQQAGRVLRHVRRELHLTQEQVAEQIGVSVRALTNWELRRRRPGVQEFPLLLAWLERHRHLLPKGSGR